MISTLDLYRTANALVQQYGPKDTLATAAQRADALLEFGDLERRRIWQGVLSALEDLVRSKSKRVN